MARLNETLRVVAFHHATQIVEMCANSAYFPLALLDILR